MKTNFCYLDNAATSFPKPQNVSREVTRCINTYCGNAGRGSHKLSLLAANKIYDCRESICNLINAPAPENIVFVPSCTFGLNLIIKGILKQGDHVLISDMEHNSVYRPIAKLQKEGYNCSIAFVIQMEGITEVRPNIITHPEFGTALFDAEKAGVKILFLTCAVTENELKII
jgi:selenocysteine lyase/cysteine desulfurase